MNWFLYDNGLRHERVKWQPHKMVRLGRNTILWLLPTNCLSVFGHFLGLEVKCLKLIYFTYRVLT